MNILQGFDLPVLKTERLVLRELRRSDDNEIFALRSNAEVNRYIGREPSASIDDARRFIEIIRENVQRNESFYWAITRTSLDALIGIICLLNFSSDRSTAEIGYELLPGHQGQGIMLEAASAVIQFAFQVAGMTLIKAETHVGNHSSETLLLKLNFEREGEGGQNCLAFALRNPDASP